MGLRLRLIATASISGCATLIVAASASATVEYNLHWGGFVEAAGRHSENLCANHRIEPGTTVHAEVLLTSVGRVLAAPGTAGARTVSGSLVCAPELDIWGHTFGPWDPGAPGGPDWLSIKCPSAHPISLLGGAGYYTSPHAHVTWRDGRSHDIHGRHDGYWHYRFHNWSSTTVSVQFWAACV